MGTYSVIIEQEFDNKLGHKEFFSLVNELIHNVREPVVKGKLIDTHTQRLSTSILDNILNLYTIMYNHLYGKIDKKCMNCSKESIIYKLFESFSNGPSYLHNDDIDDEASTMEIKAIACRGEETIYRIEDTKNGCKVSCIHTGLYSYCPNVIANTYRNFLIDCTEGTNIKYKFIKENNRLKIIL